MMVGLHSMPNITFMKQIPDFCIVLSLCAIELGISQGT